MKASLTIPLLMACGLSATPSVSNAVPHVPPGGTQNTLDGILAQDPATLGEGGFGAFYKIQVIDTNRPDCSTLDRILVPRPRRFVAI